MAQRAARNPPRYFPGQTFVGPTPGELAAWEQRFNYANQVFGDGTAPRFSEATGALSRALTGGSSVGQMADALAPVATEALTGAFRQAPNAFAVPAPTATFRDVPDFAAMVREPGAVPVNVRDVPDFTQLISARGFNTTLDPYAMAPQLGVAGSLDAREALTRQLSGAPDYSGVEASIQAATAPILRQFEQDILPALNERATFLNNPTGAIKALNRVLPELGGRMAEIATGLTEAERQRALGAQERAAQLVTQGGLSTFGLGLDAATRQRGLEQALADLGLRTDTARLAAAQTAAQLGLQTDLARADLIGRNIDRLLQSDLARAGLAQQGAQLGLQTDLARAGFNTDVANFLLQQAALGDQSAARWRDQLLGLGGLAGQLGGQASGDALRGLALFPSIVQMGEGPGNLASQYASWLRGFDEAALQEQMDRWNFQQNLPWQQAERYAAILNGLAGLGGTQTTTTPRGSAAAGVLGGALTGAQLGSMIPGIGTGIGALAGALLGLF